MHIMSAILNMPAYMLCICSLSSEADSFSLMSLSVSAFFYVSVWQNQVLAQLQVAEVHNDIQNNAGSSKQSPEGQLARAKALERGRDWSGAIDAYLGITIQDTTDLDFLEEVSFAFHTNVQSCLCPS